MSLFGRKYSLTIGRPKRAPAELPLRPGRNVPKGSDLYGLIQQDQDFQQREFKEFTNYQLKTSIVYGKTNTSVGSASRIVIENLPRESRDFIRQGDVVILEAGYEQDGEKLPRIFAGEVIDKHVNLSGIKETTTLTVGQFFTLSRQAKVMLSLPVNTSYYDALVTLVDRLKGLGYNFGSDKMIEAARPVLSTISLKRGWPIEGSAITALQDLVKKIDWIYYMVNNTIYLEPKEFPPLEKIYTLNPDNMKAPPEIQLSDIRKGVSDKKDTGYKFTTFLDGRIKPSLTVEVTSGEYEGKYKIKSVEHKLDYEGDAWTTEIVCKREGQKDG